MAARQDQTLQIFLIIFIFLFLIVAVVAYLGWRGYSDTNQTLATAESKLSEKSQQTQTQQTELEDLRQVMGFGRNDNTADVKKASEDDMKTYGAAVADEPSRTYRKVLETVHAEGQQTTAREAKARSDVTTLQKQLLAAQTEAQKKVDEYDNARKAAEKDRADEASKFAEFRKTIETNEEDLKKTLADQSKAYEDRIALLEKEKKDLVAQNTEQQHAIDIMKEDRKAAPESFEVADGRISWVNQNGTVWINLGTADSLRRQVTFSVFDSDLHDAAKTKKKGSIEVTRLLGDHMAEARITQDDPTNPILTGDNIYSQIWHRGKKLHFAITGVIDTDGDGKSDLQLARELVELNGGIVDSYLDDDGKVQGAISANTRYLVSGESPEKVSKVALQAGTNAMFKTASSLGVETITLPEFLAQMGYKPQDRTVQLGVGASAEDFPATPENDVSGRRQSQFRARPSAETAPAATPAVTPAATSN